VVAAFLASCATITGILALVPTYTQLLTEIDSYEETEVAEMQSTSTAREELRAAARTLFVYRTALDELEISDVLKDALTVMPEDVRVTGVAYARSGSTLTIAGLAGNRTALVTFSRSLESHERFSSVQLPISDLAKNTDLPFRISCAINTLSEGAQE
jgi:Tfp pilus assembly protein PilN